MATGHKHTKPTLADQETEAYQSVLTMPTNSEKFDPSGVRWSITSGMGGLKGDWRIAGNCLRSVPALQSARHSPLHDCDETTACSLDSIATHRIAT